MSLRTETTALSRSLAAAALSCALLAPSAVAADATDPEVIRLEAQLQRLDADNQLTGMGDVERLKARQAIDALAAARSKQRSSALYVAERRVRAATSAAEADALARRGEVLDRERDQILVQASRREAELARRDAERLRAQAMVRQEEASRLAEQAEVDRGVQAETFAMAEQAMAEAEQARRLAATRGREAELARQEADLASALVAEALAGDAALPPSRQVAGATVYTLAGSAFGSGRAALTTEANASLRRLAQEIGGRSASVVGFTDSQGAEAANLALSKRRADAVAAILRESGVAQVTADGRGEADPVADNLNADGRARNRRVEITLR